MPSAAASAGAYLGSSTGIHTRDDHLLFLFALSMIAVAVAMLRPKAQGGDPAVRINPMTALRLCGSLGAESRHHPSCVRDGRGCR